MASSVRKASGTCVYTRCWLYHWFSADTDEGRMGFIDAVQYSVLLNLSMSLSSKSTYGISPISGFSFANAASQSQTRMTSSTSALSTA